MAAKDRIELQLGRDELQQMLNQAAMKADGSLVETIEVFQNSIEAVDANMGTLGAKVEAETAAIVTNTGENAALRAETKALRDVLTAQSLWYQDRIKDTMNGKAKRGAGQQQASDELKKLQEQHKNKMEELQSIHDAELDKITTEALVVQGRLATEHHNRVIERIVLVATAAGFALLCGASALGML